MGLFTKNRADGQTYDGQGTERIGFIDNVFVNLEKGCLLQRYPYDNLSTAAKVTVQEGQQMVFCSEGMYSDLFEPGAHTLSTNNVPFLQRIVNIPFGGDSAFKTTLFVVSTTRQRLAGDEGGWGTGLTIRDYSFGDEGITIKVGSYGTYEFRIVDAINFIREYSGTQHEIWLGDFCNDFSSSVAQRATQFLSRYFSKERIGIAEANNFLADMSDFVRKEMNLYFADYGIELTKFDIEAINPVEDDPNYQFILQKQSEAAGTDLESRARARQRAREGYNYQQERQLDIMETAAGNEGSAGQMMGAGMGIGMGFGIGGMFGQQMGGVAQNAMQAQPINSQPYAQTPPPVPQPLQIYVLINNQQAGPYDMPSLQGLVTQGVLQPVTLVWKAGLPQWVAASTIPELAGLFAPVPPPPPVPPTPPTI